jgi:hypothetical protein
MMKVFLALVAIACVAAAEFQQTEFAFGSEANVAPQQKSSVKPAAAPKRIAREFRTVKTEIHPATEAERAKRSSGYYSNYHPTGTCSSLAGHYTYKMINHHGIFGIPLRFGPVTVNAGGIPLIDPINAWDPFNGIYNLLAAASSIGIMTISPDCTFTAEGEVLYFAQPEYLPSLDTKEQFRAGTVLSGCDVVVNGLYFEVACTSEPITANLGWLTMGCAIDSSDSFSCVTAVFFGAPDVAGVHHIKAQRTFGSLRDAPAEPLRVVENFDSDIMKRFEGAPRIPSLKVQGPKNETVRSVLSRVQVSTKTSGRVARDNHCSGIAGIFSYEAFTNIGAAGNFDYQLNRETGVSIGFATIAPDCAFQIGGYNLMYFNPQDDFYPFAQGAEMDNCEVYRSSNKWFTIDCRCSQNTAVVAQLQENQLATDGDEQGYYDEFEIISDFPEFFNR